MSDRAYNPCSALPVRLALLASLALLVIAAALIAASPAQASSIAGTVRDENGVPLAGIQVHLLDSSKSSIRSTISSADGTYSFVAGPIGSRDPRIGAAYYVGTSGASAKGYEDEFYDNKQTVGTATPVTPSASVPSVTGIDFSLSGCRWLTGTLYAEVSGGPSVPVGGAEVLVYYESEIDPRGYEILSGGGFEFYGLLPGRYKLQILAPVGYIDEWYDHKPDRTGADWIDLSGGDVTGLSIVLPSPARSISGRVTDSLTGESMPAVDVNAYDEVGNTAGVDSCDAAGAYQIDHLSPGRYKVCAFTSAMPPDCFPQWYDHGREQAGADWVDVASGSRQGIDFELDHFRTLSLWVRELLPWEPPLEGASVNLYDSSGEPAMDHPGVTTAEGFAGFAMLYPDIYRVEVSAPGHFTTWAVDGTSYSTATQLNLNDSLATEVEVLLEKSTRYVTGWVKSETGSPLGNVLVQLYGPPTMRSTETGAAGSVKGTFLFDDLPAGVINLRVPSALDYPDQWYLGKGTEELAEDVTVPATVSRGSYAPLTFALSHSPETPGTTTTSSTTSSTTTTTNSTTSSTTTTTLPPPPPAFTDVPPSSPYHDAIQGLADRGIINGYEQSDGSFKFLPANLVYRWQFAKMVVGALGLPIDESKQSPFLDLEPDTPAIDMTEFVAVAYEYRITTGKTSTEFAPYANISRAQVVTMVVRALEYLHPGVLDAPPPGYTPSWGVDFSSIHGPTARTAQYNGLLAGLPLAGAGGDPWGEMPRGEVAQVLWNTMGAIEAD